ncbi:thioredoxin family protein [[Flexibacter] sp. ATCC 35208]|uniref:thioredoxin family protein n=1 Tax=[Flexibacter] sp. ATCC 35208 TaxID=1936242 RepID=UPI0009C5D32B|nr:thioredoxin family protein [[Flexibacter] sp. ATCC 35208]OMP75024.1 thioredoxin family protein [[Flexibacter] sp. ATCC 35208]
MTIISRLFIALLCLCATTTLSAQEKHSLDLEHIYNPGADAAADLAAIQQQAAAAKKHILVQVGGNWCIWCKRFYKFTEEDSTLKSLLNNNFIVYHLNYSKENKNLPILQKLGYPQRFGFPVIVILDAKGNRLHTQDTGLLESADSYDQKKIAMLLKQWGPDALNPAYYTNQ